MNVVRLLAQFCLALWYSAHAGASEFRQAMRDYLLPADGSTPRKFERKPLEQSADHGLPIAVRDSVPVTESESNSEVREPLTVNRHPQTEPIVSPVPNIFPVPAVATDSADYEVIGLSNWNTQAFWAHLDSFLQAQNSAHTRRAYELDLIDFLSYLKTTSKPMNVHTLIEYRETLRVRTSSRTGQPLSHVSINRKIATLKSFLNWLVLNGVLPNNPAKAVKSFRAGRESPTRDIPNDRVRQMLTLPHRHTVAGRMHHAMLMVLFHLGLRRAELIGLRTSDLFEQEGMRVIRVRGKGDKERVLPLTPEVAKSIDTYLEMSRKDVAVDQPLFTPVKNNVTKTKDKPLHPNAVAYVVKHYAAMAGVQYRVSPHSARATAVSNALDNLAPHRAVQHMAGWSSPLMVTRYDKRKQELRNSAVKFVRYQEEQE
ncbi:MAG: tyrosine-type recombinase/integrase [Bdellovibrionota bacterium]